MDVLPNGGIFKELQLVHDTGYFSSACSLEEHWQQVRQPSLLDTRCGRPTLPLSSGAGGTRVTLK